MENLYGMPGHLIRRAQQVSAALFTDECAALDLTSVQFAALYAIDLHPGVDATRLSALIAFDRSTIGDVLDRMEHKGWLVRSAAPSDRRLKLISLSPAGSALLRQAGPAVRRVQDRILAPLAPADRASLIRLLAQLSACIPPATASRLVEEKPMCPSDRIAVHADDTAAAGAPPSANLIADVVTANHILFDQGVVDAFGHISARHDKRPDRFLLARNMAPGNVTAADIVEFDLDGNPVNADGRKVYLERFIHGEIFRARPDVIAVVHSHSHNIVPLSVSKGTPLRAIFHMAGFIGEAAPVFEIRDTAGDGTDLLISDNALGRALAAKFDGADIALMRGHGSTVVAGSVPLAVYRAVYAELNARYQLQAAGLGEVTYLTAAEGRACVNRVEGQVQRPWDLWKAEAARRRGL